MKFSKILFLMICTGLVFSAAPGAFAADAAPAPAPAKKEAADKTTTEKPKQPTFAETPWLERCNKDIKDEGTKRGRCEIFKRITVVESKDRLVEVAISYPKDKTEARGVFVVPLGILLQAGLQIKIDDGKPFKFQARYCDSKGCFGYVDLNETILDAMRKGTYLTLTFQAVNQKVINVKMKLKDFAPVLKGIS